MVLMWGVVVFFPHRFTSSWAEFEVGFVCCGFRVGEVVQDDGLFVFGSSSVVYCTDFTYQSVEDGVHFIKDGAVKRCALVLCQA